MRKVTDIAVGLKRQGKKSARKHSQIVNMEVVNHCFPRVPDIFLLARGGYAEASWLDVYKRQDDGASATYRR